MAEDTIPEPPPGFTKILTRGPFTTLNGPFFERAGEVDPVVQGFYALPRHANTVGVVHGGMLSIFMDGMMGHTVAARSSKLGLTVHLSIDFLHIARVHDWVIAEARMTRATRHIAFAEAVARSRGVDLVRASGVFKLMEPRG